MYSKMPTEFFFQALDGQLWSSLQFSQKINLRSKHRFSYINVHQVPREIMDEASTKKKYSSKYRVLTVLKVLE